MHINDIELVYINSTSILVKKKSDISGIINTMLFNITSSLFCTNYDAWKNGMLIQDAFPMLNVDQREFIITGIIPEEWEHINS